MDKAKADLSANKSHADSRRCIVMDFAQSCELPFFGANQAGPTYYYSPSTVNVFGLVDTAMGLGHLTAYVYSEIEGRKGARNVASMLMLFLKAKCWLDARNPGLEPTMRRKLYWSE